MLKGPTHVLRAKVTYLAAPLEVRRRDGTNDGQYGTSDQADYSVLGERDLYVHRTSTRSEATAVGEQDRSTIEGFCTADTDIAEDDRIVYDGTVFEIDEPVGVPEHDPTLLRFVGQAVS